MPLCPYHVSGDWGFRRSHSQALAEDTDPVSQSGAMPQQVSGGKEGEREGGRERRREGEREGREGGRDQGRKGHKVKEEAAGVRANNMWTHRGQEGGKRAIRSLAGSPTEHLHHHRPTTSPHVHPRLT